MCVRQTQIRGGLPSVRLYSGSGIHVVPPSEMALSLSLVLLLAAREGACGPEPLFEPHKSNVVTPQSFLR